MATENDFNSYFSSHIKRMGTGTKAVKISDKVKTGLSDFLIFKGGRAIAVECKHMKDLPKGKQRALKHPVTGPQQTFLTGMALAGVPGFVIIASNAERVITVIRGDDVPVNGNWSRESLLEARKTFGFYRYTEIPQLIEHLFLEPALSLFE